MTFRPLIVFYSKTGTTAKIVEMVLPQIKGESMRLSEPGNQFLKLFGFLNKKKNEYFIESNFKLDEYDPIILLTPIWKGNPSPAMIHFLDRIDLNGKKVVLGFVGANAENPKAYWKLHRKVVQKGSIFVETIYLRGVTPSRDWSSLSEEDYRREANRLAEKVVIAQAFKM